MKKKKTERYKRFRERMLDDRGIRIIRRGEPKGGEKR